MNAYYSYMRDYSKFARYLDTPHFAPISLGAYAKVKFHRSFVRQNRINCRITGADVSAGVNACKDAGRRRGFDDDWIGKGRRSRDGSDGALLRHREDHRPLVQGGRAGCPRACHDPSARETRGQLHGENSNIAPCLVPVLSHERMSRKN